MHLYYACQITYFKCWRYRMLFVKVRRMEMFDGDIDSVFRNNYEDEWFDEPMVQNIITSIDKNKILARNVFESEFLGIIGPDKLSGGCKALILAYKLPEMEQWIGLFGDNCIPLLINFSSQNDIHIVVSYIPQNLPENFDAEFVNNGITTHNYNEFCKEFVMLYHNLPKLEEI